MGLDCVVKIFFLFTIFEAPGQQGVQGPAERLGWVLHVRKKQRAHSYGRSGHDSHDSNLSAYFFYFIFTQPSVGAK